MRLIYKGKLQYAQDMLKDLKQDKDNFATFLTATQVLPFEYTQFHGDIDLPSHLLRERPTNLSDYLYPTMHLTTPTEHKSDSKDIEIKVQRLQGNDANRRTIQQIVDSVIQDTNQQPLLKCREYWEEFKEYLGIKKHQEKMHIHEEDAQFQILPSFEMLDFELSTQDRDYRNRGFARIEYNIKKGSNEIIAPEIRIYDNRNQGQMFGIKLATLIPSARVLYFDHTLRRDQQGWQKMWEGHFWDEGKVIIATPGTAEHRAMKDKERQQFEESSKRILAMCQGEDKEEMIRLLDRKRRRAFSNDR